MNTPLLPWPTERATLIRMVALDVDGVLTDGAIYLDNEGQESKRFYVRDGMGIRLLLQAGFRVGLLTARRSALVEHRARELSLSFVHQGVKDKWSCLQQELSRAGWEPRQCAYMGDDLVDLAVLQRVGLATAPRDADPEVLQRVHWVAEAAGGEGAVRELAENLLRTQNRWGNMIETLLEGPLPPQGHQ
ncbi:MAG: HAD hydrolase family protein [Magnetococcus sp. XQGC-1]